jgi:hypothetical protein
MRRTIGPARDSRPPRSLRRDADGTLYDLDERRTISIGELAEEVRMGRRFRAVQQGSERVCTQQVLLEVLGAVGPSPPAALAAGPGLHGLAGAVGLVAGALADRRASERGERQFGERHAGERAVERGGEHPDRGGTPALGNGRRRHRPRLELPAEDEV